MALFDYNSLKIDFINKRPYYILKVNNFYNDSTYEKIKNEFPSYKELPKYNIKSIIINFILIQMIIFIKILLKIMVYSKICMKVFSQMNL